MKIKSALITQQSGSIGGLTGSHNQGGLYFRARSVPTNPQSSFQTAVRNALTALTSAWNDDLTAAQRDAWRVYNENVTVLDRLGEPRRIGAIGHYVRSNTPRLQAGLSRVDDAPTKFDLGTFTTPTVTALAGSDALDVTFGEDDAWVDESGSALLVYGSRDQNPGIDFFKGPYRFAEAVEGDDSTPPTSPATVDSPFPLTEDNKVFLQFRVTRNDGRLSGLQRVSAIIESV